MIKRDKLSAIDCHKIFITPFSSFIVCRKDSVVSDNKHQTSPSYKVFGKLGGEVLHSY